LEFRQSVADLGEVLLPFLDALPWPVIMVDEDGRVVYASKQRLAQRVTGETRIRLAPGRFHVLGTRSPFSMMDRSVATYGEENRLWTGEEAKAFGRLAAIPSLLAERAGRSKK